MKFVDDNAREGDSVHGDEAKRMKAIVTSAGQFDNPGKSVVGDHRPEWPARRTI